MTQVSKEEIEDALAISFVGGAIQLLESYLDTSTNETTLFEWSDNSEGEYMVKFKPRMIPFGVINSWLAKDFVRDVALVRQSSFAAAQIGMTAPIQEICVFITTKQPEEYVTNESP